MKLANLDTSVVRLTIKREATAGFEPAIGVLQTLALPLGYVASITKYIVWKSSLFVKAWTGRVTI